MAVNQTPGEIHHRPVRVMLVDDHPIVRYGLAELIEAESDLTICAQASGVADALLKLPEPGPDLICLDLSLKDGSGLDLIKRLRLQCEAAKVLVVSVHDDVLFAERSLRAGASGYVCKDRAVPELVEAMRRVLDGGTYISEGISDRCALAGESPDGMAGVPNLSDREIEVFELVGHGLATRLIAERLHLSVKTIETHQQNIQKKLHLKNNAELMRCAVAWVLQNS